MILKTPLPNQTFKRALVKTYGAFFLVQIPLPKASFFILPSPLTNRSIWAIIIESIPFTLNSKEILWDCKFSLFCAISSLG